MEEDYSAASDSLSLSESESPQPMMTVPFAPVPLLVEADATAFESAPAPMVEGEPSAAAVATDAFATAEITAGVLSMISSGGDLSARKKRGRPRKSVDAGEGSSRGPHVSPSSKRGRGRPLGSRNCRLTGSLGELIKNSAGGDFKPHAMTIYAGEDVASKIISFSQKGSRGVCVLAANGTVSTVTLNQLGSSGGVMTYSGCFEILSLTGSFILSEKEGVRSKTGGLSVTLAGPDGHLIGGGVAGLLMAANPVQVVVGTFLSNGSSKGKKKKHQNKARVDYENPANIITALPVPQSNEDIANGNGNMLSSSPTSSNALIVQSLIETAVAVAAENSLNNTNGGWDGTNSNSSPRGSPDADANMPFDQFN